MGEAGFQYPFGDIEGFVSARYYRAFDAGETLAGGKQDFSYVSAVIGLAYMRW
jgi:hypothetical protein